jgi:methylated-DNA-[protein]-cysteine S-methyltransferase
VTSLCRVIDSPVGPLRLSAEPSGRLCGVHIGMAVDGIEPEPATPRTTASGHAVRRTLDDATAQLHEYFAGVRRSFDIELSMEGSGFQQQVWAELLKIPFGATVSYGKLAARIGRPGAARALGHANARNPIAVIVPCHRVIGSSGRLTGYGGGLEAKRHLLDLEARRFPSNVIMEEPHLWPTGIVDGGDRPDGTDQSNGPAEGGLSPRSVTRSSRSL